MGYYERWCQPSARRDEYTDNLKAHPRTNTPPPSPTTTLGRSQVGSLKKVSSGSGAFVVCDIAITTREGTTMKILRRYSSFEELWEGLMTSLAVSHLFFFFRRRSTPVINKRFRHIFILISLSYPPRLLLLDSVPRSLNKDDNSWNFG